MKKENTFRLALMMAISSQMMGKYLLENDYDDFLYDDNFLYNNFYNTNPIYIPKRKKLKGWQKELKRKNR